MSIVEEAAPLRHKTIAELKLITAAADMLGEVGPRAMTVRAVAERAGVNHGLVHHYFDGKEGLAKQAMLQLVQQHAADVIEQSNGNPIPAPLELNNEPRYLRAVVRAVLDGEMELATTELTAGVSIPRGALQHVAKARHLDQPDIETKAFAAMNMALEMGWAALEPFIFSVIDVHDDEQEIVRNVVRSFRESLVSKFIER